jgi:hypothetical protein
VTPVPETPARARRSFASRLLGLAFALFCFELGVFLLVFPWLRMWENNMLPAFAEWLDPIWGSPFFRGALSGIGLVNIYISYQELVQLVRG